MKRPRTVTEQELTALSTAWGVINSQRAEVRAAGALRAAAAIGRALKSLDGAIRHAQLLKQRSEREIAA